MRISSRNPDLEQECRRSATTSAVPSYGVTPRLYPSYARSPSPRESLLAELILAQQMVPVSATEMRNDV